MQGLLETWRNWKERREILRSLRSDQADQIERDRFQIKDDLTYALAALERDDRRQATDFWLRAFNRSPSAVSKSPAALRVLIGLGRYDEAAGMMEEGRKAHPNEAYYVIGLAQVAQARGDLEAAVNYFAAGRKLAPTAVESYVFAADCLTALGRLDQAEAVARQAMSVAPEDVRGFLSHARVAVKAADLPTALDRWELVIQRFDHQIGYIGAAQILRQLGRLEEAERLVVAATIRFPTDPGPPTELARIAQMRGDNTTSIVLWKKLAHRFPVTLHCLCDAASSLEALEDSSAAESVLRQAVENLPYESRPRVELARLLARRSDFLAAAEAWSELRRSFPDNEEAYVQGAEALHRAGRIDDACAVRQEHQRRFASP